MKKLLFLIPLIAFLMLGYIYKEPLAAQAENILYYSPCDTPLTYKLGSIDSKFNITTKEFLDSIESADNIWSTAYNKNLFTYDPDGEITINLVYDQRQFLNTQINELDTSVKNQQKNLDPLIADYKRRAAEFNAKMNQLNNDIESWNEKGGAPPDEYEKLKSRQAELQLEASKLQAEAEALNQSTAQYNTKVGELQQTVTSFNQALQYKPEEGEYIVENRQKTINVYFNNSQTELIHTLAHEFGHALGIGHNDNPSSIMYFSSSKITGLSDDDILGLEVACREVSIFQNAYDNFSYLLNRLELRTAE